MICPHDTQVEIPSPRLSHPTTHLIHPSVGSQVSSCPASTFLPLSHNQSTTRLPSQPPTWVRAFGIILNSSYFLFPHPHPMPPIRKSCHFWPRGAVPIHWLFTSSTITPRSNLPDTAPGSQPLLCDSWCCFHSLGSRPHHSLQGHAVCPAHCSDCSSLPNVPSVPVLLGIRGIAYPLF